MDVDRSVVAWTRALLALPAESGERLSEEWEVVRRRIEVVHRTALPRETEPAGGIDGLLDDRARVSACGPRD